MNKGRPWNAPPAEFVAFDARNGETHLGQAAELTVLLEANQGANVDIYGSGPIAEASHPSRFRQLARGVLSVFNLSPTIRKPGITVISFPAIEDRFNK